MKNNHYAVLTGDIVGSGKLEKGILARVQSYLKSTDSQLNDLSENAVIGKLGITRGDGWQLALSRPDHALRSALYVRASLKAEFSVDTRVCMGVGGVERLVKERIVESTGPAFALSGRGLDELPKNLRLDLQADSICPELQMLVRLMDCVVQRWSATESHAVAGALLGKTQEEIAETSPPNPKSGKPPTRQAVTAALKRAGWDTLSASLLFTEKRICKL